MSGQQRPCRAGKASLVVILVVVGVVCLVVGGLCGGGLTFIFAVRPAHRQWEEAIAEGDAVKSKVERETAQLGRAAESVGNLLGSAVSNAAAQTAATKTPDSEANARIIFENIRAARPQAVLKRCSPEYRQLWYTENVA